MSDGSGCKLPARFEISFLVRVMMQFECGTCVLRVIDGSLPPHQTSLLFGDALNCKNDRRIAENKDL